MRCWQNGDKDAAEYFEIDNYESNWNCIVAKLKGKKVLRKRSIIIVEAGGIVGMNCGGVCISALRMASTKKVMSQTGPINESKRVALHVEVQWNCAKAKKLKVDKNKNQFCSAEQIFHVLFITVSDPKYALVQQYALANSKPTTVCLHSKHWNVENKLMSKHVPTPFRIVSGNICSTWNIRIFIDLLT